MVLLYSGSGDFQAWGTARPEFTFYYGTGNVCFYPRVDWDFQSPHDLFCVPLLYCLQLLKSSGDIRVPICSEDTFWSFRPDLSRRKLFPPGTARCSDRRTGQDIPAVDLDIRKSSHHNKNLPHCLQTFPMMLWYDSSTATIWICAFRAQCHPADTGSKNRNSWKRFYANPVRKFWKECRNGIQTSNRKTAATNRFPATIHVNSTRHYSKNCLRENIFS